MHRAIDWISANIPPWVFILLVAHFTILGTVAYLILLERKVASWVQDRIGPNRVGLGGLLPMFPKLRDKKMGGLGQPLADGIKFIVKEDYRPAGVDRILFTLAPGVMILVIIISIAVLPWGGVKRSTKMVNFAPGTDIAHAQAAVDSGILNGANIIGQPVYNFKADDFVHPTGAIVTYDYPFQIARLNIGVLYILAALSLAVYGVVIGGWASNNKYSFLGGLRATVNMISYEIPMGLAVLCIVVMFGTLDLAQIVNSQAHYWGGVVPAWNVFAQPLAFVMFLVCIHAEANRAPFDLAEAEQELVGGYHTEYSAMRFALFFLAEYAGMITTSAVCVALFFGGWHLPWIEWAWPALHGNVDRQHPEITTSLLACIVRAIVFFAKTLFFIFVFMWVRWSLPRFRFDQLMMVAWRGLIPISLALLMMTSVVVYLFHGGNVGGGMALTLLIANVFAVALIMVISRIIPPAPATNRRLKVLGSRFAKTPLPAT